MSRRNRAPKRPVPPDPVYNSRLINMAIRRIMYSGKKSVASGLIYDDQWVADSFQDAPDAEPPPKAKSIRPTSIVHSMIPSMDFTWTSTGKRL